MIWEKHEFLDELTDRSSSMECPFCKEDEWSLIIDEVQDITNQQALNFKIFAETRDGNQISIDPVSLICRGCGFLRLHVMASARPRFDAE